VASVFERTTRTLVRRGIRDGLLGGSGQWLAVGAIAWLARFLRQKPHAKVVVEQLRLGESIVVTHKAAPPFGRKARKLDRTERDAARAERREVRTERKRAKPLSGSTSRSDDGDE
jgi:hypothetical protein